MKSKFGKRNGRTLKSQLEADIALKLDNLDQKFVYEGESIDYSIPRNYTPDFIVVREDKVIWFEGKGYFRGTDNPPKYIAIKAELEKHYIETELIFILSNPNKLVRKGRKTTMSSWCEKNGFRWCTVDTIESML